MSVVLTTSAEAFACYSSICAPPPTGSGGSSSKGKARVNMATWREGERSAAGWNARMAVEKQGRADAKVAHARKMRRKARGEKIEIGDARAIAQDARARAKTGSKIPDNPYRPKIKWAPEARVSTRESGEGDLYEYPTRGARGNAVARTNIYAQIRANALAEQKTVHWILDNHPDAQETDSFPVKLRRRRK